MYKENIFSVAEEIGTPYYIFYPDLFIENIEKFRKAFVKYYDKVIMSYSFKTNYAPFILKYVRDKKYFAEVVSNMEYDLAKYLGFMPENIIFNGPIKRENDLLKALKSGTIINLDAEYEVDSILKLVRENSLSNVKVGLRVNMEIKTDNGNSAIQSGLRESRFGMTSQVLSTVIPKLQGAGIDIISLHGHTSSTNRVVCNYKLICKKLLSVCELYHLDNLQYFDVGGGFFGAAPNGIDVSNKPSYEDYASEIIKTVSNNAWFRNHRPYLVVEPGASIVSNVFELVSKVYQHKVINGKNFIITDATVFNVKAMATGAFYPFETFSKEKDSMPIIADIVGSSCMEIDRILSDVEIKNYSNGDLVVFKGVGAYKLNMTPCFINYQLPVVTFSSYGTKEVMRSRQNIKDITRFYNI